MPSLPDLLDEISARGWLVNNLFQLDDGTWQANLRTATHVTVFAYATGPRLALAYAIDLIESAELLPAPVPIIAYDELVRPSLRSLLSRRLTLTRRI